MSIDFKRIGYEFRRIASGNSPIETAVLILNQNFDSTQSLDRIIGTKSYETLLQIVVIFYRKFSTNSIIHFDNLLRFANILPHPQLGTYAFLQVILGTPDIPIPGQKIHLVLQKFPSFTESIILSRIYSNPHSLFPHQVPPISPKQTTIEYLLDCDADSSFLDCFLSLTFKQAVDYFHQLYHKNLHPSLIEFLSETPVFFCVIDQLVPNQSQYFIKQVLKSKHSKKFLDLFFTSYKSYSISLKDQIIKNFFSFLNFYIGQISFEMYQHVFLFILENQVPYITFSNCSNFYNDYFQKCINQIFSEKPELIFETIFKFDIKHFDSQFRQFIKEIDLYEIKSKVINDILDLPHLAMAIQIQRPKFFTFVLNRFPRTVEKVSNIIRKFGVNLFSQHKHSLNPLASQLGDEFSDLNAQENLPNSFPRLQQETSSNPHFAPIQESSTKFPRFIYLIYQIDQIAFCHCFEGKSRQIVQFLMNFVPAEPDEINFKQIQHPRQTTHSSDTNLKQSQQSSDSNDMNLKQSQQSSDSNDMNLSRGRQVSDSDDIDFKQLSNSNESCLNEKVVNPRELDFPTGRFFDECQELKLLSTQELAFFILKNAEYMIKTKKWMKLITNHPYLFVIFSKVIFYQPQFSDQSMRITIDYAISMLPRFRNSQTLFTNFMTFVMNNSNIIDLNSFPFYLKIELASLLFSSPTEQLFDVFLPLIFIMCEDYRTIDSLENQTKLMLFNQGFFRNYLDSPSVHAVYLIIFQHQLIVPNEYVHLIHRNLHGIRKSLRENPCVFEKWYQYVFIQENAQILRFIINEINTGKIELGEFVLNVLFDALSHIQFQENIEFLQCLLNQLEPNINQDDNLRIGKMENINLHKQPLKSFLKKKKELDTIRDPTPLKEIYNAIYEVLRHDYTKNLFQIIPFVAPSTQLQQTPPIQAT